MALFLSLTVFVLQVALMIELQTYLDITSAVTFDFSDQYQYLTFLLIGITFDCKRY